MRDEEGTQEREEEGQVAFLPFRERSWRGALGSPGRPAFVLRQLTPCCEQFRDAAPSTSP